MKAKKTAILFVIIFVLLCVCTMSACNDEEPITYTLSFVGEGAKGNAPADISAQSGAVVTLPENAFALEGYYFGGWNDGNTTYAAGSAYTVTSSRVFSAVWIVRETESVAVSFDTDGGKSLLPVTVTRGQALSPSDTPIAEKNGYAFVEWCLDKGLTKKLNAYETVFLADTTLYASYRELPTAKVSVFEQEEATLPYCPFDISLLVACDGSTALSKSNLNDFLTVTADGGQSIPTLSVTEEQVDGKAAFRLTPDTALTQRGIYSLSLAEPFRFLVTAEAEDYGTANVTLSVKKIELLISGENLALQWDFEKYSYGDDASEIMTRNNVVSYRPEGFTVNGVEYVVDSVHWYPDPSVLSYITGDVKLYPIHTLSRPSHLYKFDAGGGKLPTTYAQYEKGVKVAKNEKLSAETVEKLIPTKPSDMDFDYEFKAWNVLENDVLRPVAPEEYVSVADVTFVASYTAVPRTYKTTLYADGISYDYDDESGEFIKTSVTAHYAQSYGAIIDEDGERIELNQSHSDWKAMLGKLDTLNDCPLPVPIDAAYEFSFWTTYTTAETIEAYPIFRLKDVQVSVIFEMGEGQWQGVKGTLVSSIDVPTSGSAAVCYVSNFFTPEARTEATVWDGENSINTINCCFIDDSYAYVAAGWSKTDGGAPILPADEDNELRLSAQSGDVTLYAVYDRIPLAAIVNFYISTADESFSDGQGGGIRTLVRGYGTSLAMLVPSAEKRSEDPYYYYEFLGWRAESSGTIGVTDTFENNENYTAVFERRLKEITVTFNAGNYGTFPSTDSSTIDMKVLAGSVIYFSDVEAPVFECDSKYFNIYFVSWGYTTYYQTGYYDETLTARTKRVRNQVTTDTPVGITVSKGSLSEDIGQNSIEGYVYDPISKTLQINGEGLTLDGGRRTYDLNVQMLTSGIALKDITINGNISANIYPNDAGRLANAFRLVIEGNVVVSKNITETDEYCSSAVWLYGLNAEIVGTGSNPSLTVNYTVSAYNGEGERADTHCNIIYANSLAVKNITLNVNADLPQDYSANGLKIEELPAAMTYGLGDIPAKLSLFNTAYNASFSESDATRYAVCVDADGEFTNDGADIICIGCVETP